MHDTDLTSLETGMPASGVTVGEFEGVLPEAEELELASELLEVTDGRELEQFLGNAFRAVGRAAGQFVRSDVGRSLVPILRDAARRALPALGRAAGQWIEPRAGGAVGADLGSRAAQLLGLELEGLSAEDREFEAARQLVRFVTSAIRGAAAAPAASDPATCAASAVTRAASAFAPGLLRRMPGRSGALWPRSGRWVRRGRTVVLYGD